MLKAIVVDDEKPSCIFLSYLLKNTDRVEVVGTFTNAYDTLRDIRTLEPDVVFLDVEMPEINGLELAEKIYSSNLDCEIVFTTAYNKYALEAFKVNALDYLLKPIIPDELLRAVERVEKRKRKSNEGNHNCSPAAFELKVTLLGNYSIYNEVQARPTNWVTAKCGELFAFLLLRSREGEISKWKLMEALWPEKEEEKGYINLRSTVSRINKTLREHGLKTRVTASRTGYKLEADKLMVDAFRLEAIFEKMENAEKPSLEELEDAIRSYKGGLFAEMDYLWCEQDRERYYRFFLALVHKLIALYHEIDVEPMKTLQTVNMITEYDPYNEEAHELALVLHYKIEGIRGAVEYYKSLCALFRAELDIEPRESIQKLYQTLLV